MVTVRTDEFRKDAVRITLTSGLSRCQAGDDPLPDRVFPKAMSPEGGGGLSILNKWVNAYRDTDVVPSEDRELSRETERLRREIPLTGTTCLQA